MVDSGVVIDAGRDDACIARVETCNGSDDDCDGATDEGTASDLGCDFVCAAGTCAAVTDVATGSVHSCVLLSTGEVRCWGDNRAGQLGDGTLFNRHQPAPVEMLPPVRAISAGGDHTCAITLDDRLYCWGGNAYAQIGDGAHENRPLPVAVDLAGVDDVMAGGGHTCVRIDAADVRCWGLNTWGQVGSGTISPEIAVPTSVVSLTGVSALSGDAGQHTCAIVSGGLVSCWGDDRVGQMGSGSTSTGRSTPVMIPGLSGTTTIADNIFHGCAIGTSGVLRCWGDNAEGRVGDGTTTTRLSPVTIALSSVTVIATARTSTCAGTSDGALRCWGSNARWQLGVGESGPMSSTAPTAVPSLTRVVEIEGGHQHFCARTETDLFCWGDNASGQIGVDPASADRIGVPTEIVL